MLNSQLVALIPDQPYAEFTEVGQSQLKLLKRWFMKTCYGFSGVGRRVWTNPDGEDLTLLDVSLVRVHSHSDAAKLIAGARPSSEVIAGLAAFHLTVSDTPDGICTASWRNGGLTFLWLAKAVQAMSVEVEIAAADPDRGAGSGRRAFARLESELGGQPESKKLSLGPWAAVFWGIAYLLPPMAFFIFGGFTLGYFLGPDPLPLITMLIGAVLFIRVGTARSTKNSSERLLGVWSKMCRDGDSDGTVRRALASVGHSLPPPERQPTGV